MMGALLDRSLTNTAGLLAVFAVFQSEKCSPIFRQSSDRQMLAALLYSYYIASLWPWWALVFCPKNTVTT